MWKRRAYAGSAWSAADYFINRLLTLTATSALIARALTVEGFGVFSTALTAAQSVWVLTDFGITLYGIRELASAPSDAARIRTARELQAARLMLAAVVFAGMVLAVWTLPLRESWRLPVTLSGVFVLVYSLYPDWYFKAAGRFREVALAGAVSSALYAAAVFAFVRGPGGVHVACGLWACSFLPAAAVLMRTANSEGAGLVGLPGKDEIAKALAHLKKSRHFLFGAVSANLYVSAPVYVLSLIAGERAAGHFNASYRLYIYISSALLPVSHVFFPLLSGSGAGGGGGFMEKQRFFQRLSFVVILPVALMVGMCGRDIVPLLYGPGYAGGGWVLAALSLPVVMSTLRLTLSNPIAASGNQRSLANVSLVMMLFCAAACWTLTGRYGMAGAVYAVAASEAVFLAALAALYGPCLKVSAVSALSGVSWKAPAGALLMFGVVRAAGGFTAHAAGLGLAAYIAVLVATGEFGALTREAVQ